MSTSSLGTYFLLFFFLAAAASVSSEDCTYTILVKTGTAGSSGTDSNIGAILKDENGLEVKIPNLVQYGKMGSGDYFESGNLDTFAITTTCMESPVCSLTLSSDNSGYKYGWYVEYVQVMTDDPRGIMDNILFEIYGWLASDEAPYALRRTFNKCPKIQLQQIIDAIS